MDGQQGAHVSSHLSPICTLSRLRGNLELRGKNVDPGTHCLGSELPSEGLDCDTYPPGASVSSSVNGSDDKNFP